MMLFLPHLHTSKIPSQYTPIRLKFKSPIARLNALRCATKIASPLRIFDDEEKNSDFDPHVPSYYVEFFRDMKIVHNGLLVKKEGVEGLDK